MNQELSNYVVQSRAAGIGDEEIKKQLLASGWQEVDANEALSANSSSSVPQPSAKNDTLQNNKAVYRRANILVWVGFLGAAIFSILNVFTTGSTSSDGQPIPAIMPSLKSFGPVFSILWVVSALVFIYACFLALKAKKRSYLWILALLFLTPPIGGVVIFSLKNKSIV